MEQFSHMKGWISPPGELDQIPKLRRSWMVRIIKSTQTISLPRESRGETQPNGLVWKWKHLFNLEISKKTSILVPVMILFIILIVLRVSESYKYIYICVQLWEKYQYYLYTRTTIPSAQTLQPLDLFWSLQTPRQWERVVSFQTVGTLSNYMVMNVLVGGWTNPFEKH